RSPQLMDPPLSKNAQKRILKQERFAAQKAERRAREKAKRKERAVEKRQREDSEEPPANKRRKVDGPKRPFNARVVIDLGFDDLMNEKEVVSLCSQLAYTYSSNRRSPTPFQSVLCTSLNGKTLARMHVLGDQHHRWHRVDFWENSYEHLWAESDASAEIAAAGTSTAEADTSHPSEADPSPKEPIPETNPTAPPKPAVHKAAKESIVYLTGDADEELTELKEGETYIIGGICDHNRYKNLCMNKAATQSLRYARLPIGTYIKNLPSRKILTVNQVFDILLQWVETRDWEKALYSVMPKRKFQQGGAAGTSISTGDAGVTVVTEGDVLGGYGD
ncbi:hypothetical protein M422DRAFT_134047, partial [Sphaerobolus stellatus SS14]